MKITGRVEIKVNGDTLLNKAGAVASGLGLSGVPNFERTEVMGDTGLHGFVEEPVIAMLEVTITDNDGVNLADFAAINGDGTVVFQSAGGSGKYYTMATATCTSNMQLTAGQGETTLVFKGPYWTEGIQ